MNVAPMKPVALANLKTLSPDRFRAISDFEPREAEIERQLSRLPHLDRDHRLMVRNARADARDAQQARDAAEAIERLPRTDETLHLAISGRFALWDIVPGILAMTGQRIDELWIATLGFSRRNIDALCRLIDADQIGNASLLCSHYFKGTSGGIFEHADAQFAQRADRTKFASARTHAKILLIKLASGQTYAVESSANLRSCKNIEQITLIGSPVVFDFHRGWMMELFDAGAKKGQ
jgi:hypothetical protein